MNTENDVIGEILKDSTTPTSSSTRSTSRSTSEFNEVKEANAEPKMVTTEHRKTQQIILNKFLPSERSIGGGVQSADLDQPGGVDAAREPGESALLPGVQAPRECLPPRRQVDKVGSAGWLLADVQGDPFDSNVTDGHDMATGDVTV